MEINEENSPEQPEVTASIKQVLDENNVVDIMSSDVAKVGKGKDTVFKVVLNSTDSRDFEYEIRAYNPDDADAEALSNSKFPMTKDQQGFPDGLDVNVPTNKVPVAANSHAEGLIVVTTSNDLPAGKYNIAVLVRTITGSVEGIQLESGEGIEFTITVD